jgi:hypothetical protein
MIEAYKMARSGNYPHHISIEALLLDRYPEADAWFAIETVRMALRKECMNAFMKTQHQPQEVE